MNIEFDEWVEGVLNSLKSIDEKMTEMVETMKETLKGVSEWRSEDNVHHKEENNLIAQIKEVKDIKRGVSDG
ncbi:hypothetical protein AYK24_08365 [Thermoplasmatales archaeon SG8-52-4]|nr:MAG: hypothetical protein AYK24_08365 [Thermoplasmatales archaeon SG8-52-4]